MLETLYNHVQLYFGNNLHMIGGANTPTTMLFVPETYSTKHYIYNFNTNTNTITLTNVFELSTAMYRMEASAVIFQNRVKTKKIK
jgi:hypothetical protein